MPSLKKEILVSKLEPGDKIYVGQRRIAEVAEVTYEFSGYAVRMVGGGIYWYRPNKRLLKQVPIDETLPNHCTLSCSRGHDRVKYSRSSDGGFTFICVKCIWG